MRLSHYAAVGAATFATLIVSGRAAMALTLTPGTIVGEDSVTPGGTSATLVHYSLTGTLLGSFASNRPFIDGLDVIPVPEPTALALLGGVAVAGLRCRGRGRGR